jgi:farnesyl-diphosphate farnesyltransferase
MAEAAARLVAREDDPGIHPWLDDEQFQERILPGVSRTFALTIPQLPDDLKLAVSNAYLLCRIADTIEDDPLLEVHQKEQYHRSLVSALSGGDGIDALAASTSQRLFDGALPAERELIASSPRVVRVTYRLGGRQRAAIRRCVSIMSSGMAQFERNRNVRGLATLADLERYCYFVAGVVGEMLTDLFCAHSPLIQRRHAALMERAVHFGQGLQLTNILKDAFEDLEQGACWLPRDVFAEEGFDLDRLATDGDDPAFAAGMDRLIGVAHANLRDALRYTLLIPRSETGIRRFLTWAIGLAVLTLQNIHRRPGFTSGTDVKVSRRTVMGIIGTTNAVIRSNMALSALFRLAARGLPLACPSRGEVGRFGVPARASSNNH